MRWTIQRKLTVLVLIVLVPLMTGVLLEFWGETRAAQDHAQEEMLATAHVAVRLLDEIVGGQIENLQALAALRELGRIEDSDLAALAGRLRVTHPFVRGLFTAAADGRVLAVSDRRSAESALSVADRADFRSAMRAREPQVGAPQPGLTDPRLAVQLFVPVLDRQGAPVGVACTELDLLALSAFLDRLPAGQASGLVVVTSAGTVVARSGPAGGFVGRPFSPAPAALALIRQGSGVAEWRWEDGQLRLAGAVAMTRTPWVVVASAATNLVAAPGQARLLADLRWVALVTLLALLVAAVISRRLSRSVQALIAGARGLAAGEAPPIVVPTRDELAELALRFNQSMEERRVAREAAEARQRRLETLGEMSLALSRELEREPLLQQITDTLARLTGAPNVVLWDVDAEARRLVRRARTTDPSVQTEDFPAHLAFGQGGVGWIATHRELLIVEDVTSDERMQAVAWARRYDLLSFVGLPVLAGDELVGVLSLNLRRGRVVDEGERALLLSVGAQAAVALRNARLFAQAEARRHTAETLADLGQVLSRALDPEVVAREVVAHVRGLLAAHSSALYQLEPESGDLVALAVAGDVGPTFVRTLVFPRGAGAVGLAVRERRAIASENVLADPRVTLTPETREAIEGSVHRSVLAAPLVSEDVVIGALSVGDRDGRVFDADERRLIQAFADRAALALDNARLHEQMRQRLRHVDSLREVIEPILEPFTLEDRLNLITRKAAELVGGDRAALALMVPDGSGLQVQAGHGLFEGELGSTVALGQGGLGVAAARREGVLVTDYQRWPQRRPCPAGRQGDRPVLGAIAYPLLFRKQVIGALSVGVHTPGKAFSAADLDRLAGFAGLAALAIEHSRLYQELETRLGALEARPAQLVQAAELPAAGRPVSGVAQEPDNPL